MNVNHNLAITTLKFVSKKDFSLIHPIAENIIIVYMMKTVNLLPINTSVTHPGTFLIQALKIIDTVVSQMVLVV
jgi:hypothetical protein